MKVRIKEPSNCLYCVVREALDALAISDKLIFTHSLYTALKAGQLLTSCDCSLQAEVSAQLPVNLKLTHPRNLPRRSLQSREGQAAMIHAIAHIEYNAINLALDAVYRYRDMPADYYIDWLRVADEEAHHFSLLAERLADLGYEYGDFPAHTGLWDMAQKTAAHALHRMALVPRAMEARGLDVTPGIMRRFEQIKDDKTVAALRIIQEEEVGHVEIGTKWFHYLCRQQNKNPQVTWMELYDHYLGGIVRPPLNLQARELAGFSAGELKQLEERCTQKKH
ncbi:MAG: ferritin-like domain-containing protein [gamma proteobacterium symbiont of Bathyaustriella thionipta]|nr:ferritin-like domain-containing protein [gamma proteobacterium symbiont of Bathyaustriella thionipta]